MKKRKIDFSHIPMPEALSYFLLLIDPQVKLGVVGTGWNTKTNRIEYVQLNADVEINEATAKFIESKEPVKSFAEIAAEHVAQHKLEEECPK